MMIWLILFVVFWFGVAFFAYAICRAGANADRKTKQMLRETIKNGQTNETRKTETQPEAQISDEPVGNNTKPNKDKTIGSAGWTELCRLANNIKHPEDHQPFGVARLVNKCTRSNVFGISGPNLSIAQREIAEEWLRQWSAGIYKCDIENGKNK